MDPLNLRGLGAGTGTKSKTRTGSDRLFLRLPALVWTIHHLVPIRSRRVLVLILTSSQPASPFLPRFLDSRPFVFFLATPAPLDARRRSTRTLARPSPMMLC